jgi:ketosteroid isomerase-like protein
MAARRKTKGGAARSRRKSTARKPARKSAGARRARPQAARRKKVARGGAGASPAEALARKIVRVSNDPDFPFVELYTEDCVSTEATGETFRGHEGLAEKMKNWESMQQGSTFRPRNVLVKGNVICIEWEGTVHLRDGRTVALHEVAVHEVRGGKIVSERYYYNPLAMAPAPDSPA